MILMKYKFNEFVAKLKPKLERFLQVQKVHLSNKYYNLQFFLYKSYFYFFYIYITYTKKLICSVF